MIIAVPYAVPPSCAAAEGSCFCRAASAHPGEISPCSSWVPFVSSEVQETSVHQKKICIEAGILG